MLTEDYKDETGYLWYNGEMIVITDISDEKYIGYRYKGKSNERIACCLELKKFFIVSISDKICSLSQIRKKKVSAELIMSC